MATFPSPGTCLVSPIVDPRTHINGTVIGEIRAVYYQNQLKGGDYRKSYDDGAGGYQMLNATGTPKAQVPPTIINLGQ